MRIGQVILLVLVAVAVTACDDPTEEFRRAELAEEFQEIPGGRQGYTEVDTASLAPLGTQLVLNSPVTLDTSKLTGPIGEPPLTGDAVVTFVGAERVDSITQEGRALAGGTGATYYDAREGIFLVVYYTVENKTEGNLQPVTHINSNFKAVDAQGRLWEQATFASHGFSVAYAIGVVSDKGDPRAAIGPGESVTTGIAFDVSVESTGVKLRAENLDIEVTVPDVNTP